MGFRMGRLVDSDGQRASRRHEHHPRRRETDSLARMDLVISRKVAANAFGPGDLSQREHVHGAAACAYTRQPHGHGHGHGRAWACWAMCTSLSLHVKTEVPRCRRVTLKRAEGRVCGNERLNAKCCLQ